MADNISSASISALLKKTEHYDKDERYMATSDLCEVLKRQSEQGHLETATERQICTAVLRLLHDKSNDVQAIAVKTLGVLLTTVQQEQVLEIADSLADQVLDASKSELRDVYAIGLRTLCKTVPSSMGDKVSARLVTRLLDGIRHDNEEIVLACLDILTDLLTRFGATSLSVTRQHEPILQQCLLQLSSPAPVVRKRAGTTIGCLSVVLSDALLNRMVEALLSQIDMAEGVGKEGKRKTSMAHGKQEAGKSKGAGDTRALIRTMCTVSGAVGHRLGQEQIDRILPIFLRFTEPEDAVTGDDSDDEMESGDTLANELRESCFMGFESFILRCPKQVTPHLNAIIQASLAYMSYDPNYSYGTEGTEAEGEDEDLDEDEEENEYEDDEEEEEEDDDDESWKVRRSAIRTLMAVVEAQKNDPSPLWTYNYKVRRGKTTVFGTALVNRFKEREENCRVGVIDCFNQLLAVTVAAAEAGVVSLSSSSDEMDTSTGVVIDLRSLYAPKIVKACETILTVKKGNERSKSSALSLLATLCRAPGGVGRKSEISSVFRYVQTFLASGDSDMALHREGTSKALRLDALTLVHALLSCGNHNATDVRQSLKELLLHQLCDAVNEQWYKVISEALRALASVPYYFVHGYSDDVDPSTKSSECSEVATMLYNAVEPFLAAHDIDQEIKECALHACASLLSSLHANLTVEQMSRMLHLLLDRLKNETTRIAAIKTLSSIAESSKTDDRIDLTPILPDSIATMSSFLKLQNRSTKQAALEALNVVVKNHGSNAIFGDGELYSSVLQDLAPLIGDADLHLCHLSMRAAISILKVYPATGPAVKAHVLEPALDLSTSSLIQDLARDSLLALFRQIIISGSVDFEELLFLLRHRLSDKVGKNGIYNLAKCIAVITAATTRDNSKKVLEETLSLLDGSATPADPAPLRQVQLALLITGDFGRMIDLNSIDGAAEKLKNIYVGYFDSASEDLKNAAAYALGNASVGSQAIFLPAIVSKLDEDNKKQQYLLLSALREFIHCSFRNSDGDGVAQGLPVILPPLEKHCAESEEGIRTMVSECLGALTCLKPSAMFEKLEELQNTHSLIKVQDGVVAEDDITSQHNANVCWTIATSIKLAIAGKVDSAELASHMPNFAKLLDVNELHVRNAALLMVFSAMHHMPHVLSGLMESPILPALFEVSELTMERTVDLGPFRHTVDDALPLRKAALSIFALCLDTLPGSLDIGLFIPVLVKALGDAEDVQLHAHQIVISMCKKHPTQLVNCIDMFIQPLEKTLNKKPGQKTGTELERLNDWIKSALRVTLKLSKLEGAMNSQKFAEFVERVKANDAKFGSMMSTLEEEQ